MIKYTQKFKLDLIQEYLDTGCSQRCLENKYSLPMVLVLLFQNNGTKKEEIVTKYHLIK